MRFVSAAMMTVLLVFTTLTGMPDEVNTPFREANRLTPPKDRDSFTFAILGDRTGGPESGLAILEQAVIELIRLDPDLVMNVGDMINGYNAEAEWIGQMQRFKRIMSKLRRPWYPVPGNHDVYAPGGNPRNRANEKLYKKFFGPLYYSFDYKNTHFIVLYSDEKLSFRNPPKDQQMSEEQLIWLKEDLAAVEAKHTFAFLHHPRWNYAGDVWEPVHEVLAENGKVSAVFAGHWHRYRSDGVRDGIRYYCMATTGGYSDNMPAAGMLHHYNLVSVTDEGWTMTCVPVGVVLDPDFVTGQESDDVRGLSSGEFLTLKNVFPAPIDGPRKEDLEVNLVNPTSKELALSLQWSGLPEEGWWVYPEEASLTLMPGEDRSLFFFIEGDGQAEGESLPPVAVEAELLYPFDKGGEQAVRSIRPLKYDVPPVPAELAMDVERPATDRALLLDGVDNCVIVDSADALNPEGAFTLECWARLEEPPPRAALLAKTQSSAYGIFLADGDRRAPSFLVNFQGKGYAFANGEEKHYNLGDWTHFAGVFDGGRICLYVNGHLAAETVQEGAIRGNKLPFIVGADVDGNGRPVSFARGMVDEVRLSRGARYHGAFEPRRRFQADAETLLLLHLDTVFGDRTPDTSGKGFHGRISGGGRLVEVHH